MKILFTGASSFTGYWFVRELLQNGHEVVATLRQPASAYSDVRALRVNQLKDLSCKFLEGVSFGDEAFIEAVKAEGNWDVLCHHAADVTDYKSPDFDVNAAVANNTHNIKNSLATLLDKGCSKLLLTGSVFEADEGAGSEGLEAFSPYGLSKALTANMFRYYAQEAGFTLGKFVIPNPFGPYEEPRFTSYLARTWYKGETPAIKTPDYVRDNIHVSLLAKEYNRFLDILKNSTGFVKLGPSGYVGSQGAFAYQVAEEMKKRLGLACDLECLKQESFDEPRIRINTDIPAYQDIGWDEDKAWDELAEYYASCFSS